MSERPFSDIVTALGHGSVRIRVDHPAGDLDWNLPHARVHELISALWLANGQLPVYTEDTGTIAAWLRALDGYPHTTGDPFADMDRHQLWDACHALGQKLLAAQRRLAFGLDDLNVDRDGNVYLSEASVNDIVDRIAQIVEQGEPVMGRDAILTAEDGTRYSLSNIRTQGWLDGHTSGLDAAIAFLHERAVTLFRERKDDQARAIRDLADLMNARLRPEMDARAKNHERDHHMIVDDEDRDGDD